MRICGCEMSVAVTRSLEIYAISVDQNLLLGERQCLVQHSRDIAALAYCF